MPMLCFLHDDTLFTVIVPLYHLPRVDATYRLFQEVPECESDRTEESFMDFPAGTPVAEIEAWFDERFDGGIEELREITG